MMQHVREEIIKFLEERISQLILDFDNYEDHERALEELKRVI